MTEKKWKVMMMVGEVARERKILPQCIITEIILLTLPSASFSFYRLRHVLD